MDRFIDLPKAGSKAILSVHGSYFDLFEWHCLWAEYSSQLFCFPAPLEGQLAIKQLESDAWQFYFNWRLIQTRQILCFLICAVLCSWRFNYHIVQNCKFSYFSYYLCSSSSVRLCSQEIRCCWHKQDASFIFCWPREDRNEICRKRSNS